MFAIREVIKDKLYVAETPDGNDALTLCFSQWQDVQFVRDYLKKNGGNSVEGRLKEVSKQVLSESRQFFEELLQIIRNKPRHTRLDELFEPLHKDDDFTLQHVATKAYGKVRAKSWLRLYAIRFEDGCYLVLGGMIKTHRAMQDSKEGKDILNLFKKWRKFLEKENIEGAFELVTLVSEK